MLPQYLIILSLIVSYSVRFVNELQIPLRTGQILFFPSIIRFFIITATEKSFRKTVLSEAFD